MFKNIIPLVCTPNPCFNSGTCIQTGPTVGYCLCPAGYTGSLCQSCNSQHF